MKRSRTRKNYFLLLLALFWGMGTSFAAQFSAVCSTGQTLYYNIISTTEHQVQLTFPGNYSTPYPSNFPKPTGNITLPSAVSYNGETYTVVMIGPRTFMNCSGLTGSLTIPNSVIEIGDNAFDGCTGFTGNLTIGNSVTKIDYMAFSGCSGFTGSLTLGNLLSEIGYAAFSGCSGFTGSLTIPNSVTSIDGFAFKNCSGFTGSLTLGNSLATIGTGAFSFCSGFTGSLTIPNSLTTIGSNVFSHCTGFSGPLVIPDSVTEIDEYAFSYCNGFTGSLTIGNSVTSIGVYAFSGCNNLRSATIGSSVTTIGNGAFSECYHLATVTVLSETPPTLDTYTFSSAQSNFRVYVPCTALEYYQTAPVWNGYTILCLPETITVYDGTVTNAYIPAFIYDFDVFTRSQFVIPAIDLLEMKGTAISSMTFYTTSNNIPYTAVSGTYVYLKEVDYTEISLFEPRSSATTVFGGYLSIVSAGDGGEMTINFNTPYTYHGGNLLVGIENPEANDYKDIRFYGKVVNRASIAGSHPDGLNSVIPTQRNFIPKTTFSYHPTSAPQPLPYFCSFEDEEELLPWTLVNCESSTETYLYAAHAGNQGFRFYYGTNPPQYLVSPKLEGTEEVNVSFYYKNADNDYPETFQVGYSTTTKSPDAFTWGEALTAENQNAWMRYENTFPEGTRYVAVMYTSYDEFYLYIDDFSINPVFCSPEDQCELVFELSDAYGDGWEGNAIKVSDFETGAVLAMMANDHYSDEGLADTQVKLLYACNGRDIRFDWVRGYSPHDCSFAITDDNGEVILEVEDCSDFNTGDFLDDYNVSCGVVLQTISLASGVNWFSTNVEITLDELKAALVESFNGTTLVIKSQNKNTRYLPAANKWSGSLNNASFDVSSMYVIVTDYDAEIVLEGMPINPADHPVTIVGDGITYLAYPFATTRTPAEAFAGFAITGDVVKSQSQNARCVNGNTNRWSGGLSTLEPGKGYKYISKASSNRTFTFPTEKGKGRTENPLLERITLKRNIGNL